LFYCAGSPANSIKGNFTLTETDQIYLTHQFEWTRAPRPSSRFYPDLLTASLTGEGARYVPLAKGQLPLPSLLDTPDNVQLSFIGGGLSEAAVGDEWQHLLSVKPNHTVILPAGSAAGSVTRMTFNPATGAFSGAFELTDPASPRPIKRIVPFSGLISPILYHANGLFLLPQLPDSTATPPTTLTTSPILSGKVYWAAP
jgi:hypothetical protein